MGKIFYYSSAFVIGTLIGAIGFYERASAMAGSTQEIPLEIFIKSSAEFNDSNLNVAEKKKSVAAILKLLDENPQFPQRHYWRAVFLTFQCELEDKGRMIPRCIIGELSNIKGLLNQAHQDYPSYYHFAPARTLGIMYFQMPAIVGGSNKKALAFLKEAHDGAPDFAENREWLHKVEGAK